MINFKNLLKNQKFNLENLKVVYLKKVDLFIIILVTIHDFIVYFVLLVYTIIFLF